MTQTSVFSRLTSTQGPVFPRGLIAGVRQQVSVRTKPSKCSIVAVKHNPSYGYHNARTDEFATVLSSPQVASRYPVPAFSNHPGTHITHRSERMSFPHLVRPPHSRTFPTTTMLLACQPAPYTRNTLLRGLVDRVGFLTINPDGLKPPRMQETRRRTTQATILYILTGRDDRPRMLVRDTPTIRQDAKIPHITLF